MATPKNNELTKKGEETVKKKRGRGGTENFPSSLAGTKKEDVQRIGSNLLKWYKMPKAVTDEEIAERLNMFFETCIANGEVMTVDSK